MSSAKERENNERTNDVCENAFDETSNLSNKSARLRFLRVEIFKPRCALQNPETMKNRLFSPCDVLSSALSATKREKEDVRLREVVVVQRWFRAFRLSLLSLCCSSSSSLCVMFVCWAARHADTQKKVKSTKRPKKRKKKRKKKNWWKKGKKYTANHHTSRKGKKKDVTAALQTLSLSLSALVLLRRRRRRRKG